MKMKSKKQKRVYVTATDGATKKSACTTVYDATPSEVISILDKASKRSEATNAVAAGSSA